nr:Chain B, PR domain zinc finger protein 16 [Homo sapiens]6BW4_D Chain D, PR domain zinc finger protein 16 [Homo sapiens]
MRSKARARKLAK